MSMSIFDEDSYLLPDIEEEEDDDGAVTTGFDDPADIEG